MEQAASGDTTERTGRALADADRRLGACGIVLEHRVALGPCRLLDDRTVARVGSLLSDLSAQLAGPDTGLAASVREMLAGRRAILTHLLALSVEARLAETLAVERGLDPRLPPLLRRQTDATDTIALIAAQTRMDSAMRAMRLPLDELPGDLQHLAWSISHVVHADHGQTAPMDRAASAAARPARLDLQHQVLLGLGDDLQLALRIDEAGLGLFLSALALASGIARDTVALATAEDDPLRLALILRAAGLTQDAAAMQLLAIRPDADSALVDVGDAEQLLQGGPR